MSHATCPVNSRLELLASLSRTPAALSDLCDDFACEEHIIKNRIADLRREGITIVISDGHAWIPSAHFQAAKYLGQQYWHSVYADAA